ncbi:MAG: exosome complex protein Rrp42 [archaeon]
MNYGLKNTLLKSLEKNIRFDRRGPLDYREIKVEYSVAKNAEGSARVKIGDTEVIAGVKMAIEKPYPDTPNQGLFMVGAELLPMSNPEFESGPPGIQAIELARVVDRGIRESKALDTKTLCIEEGEKAWMIAVDICIINDSGNLFDSCALASFAALQDTRFPGAEDNRIDYKKMTDRTLELQHIPVGITIHKIGTRFIVDPTTEEELVSDARLTVVSREDGTICALQKGGDAPLNAEEVEQMVDIGIEKGNEIRNLLK